MIHRAIIERLLRRLMGLVWPHNSFHTLSVALDGASACVLSTHLSHVMEPGDVLLPPFHCAASASRVRAPMPVPAGGHHLSFQVEALKAEIAPGSCEPLN